MSAACAQWEGGAIFFKRKNSRIATPPSDSNDAWLTMFHCTLTSNMAGQVRPPHPPPLLPWVVAWYSQSRKTVG